MNKIVIGLLFILVGLGFGSLAIDKVYDNTLGYLVRNDWIQPPTTTQLGKNIFGRKTTILIYAFIFIIIGIFILVTD